MPRKERKHSETGIYHLMLRGINRQDIFDEDADYWALIRTLSSIQYRLNEDLVTKVCTCHIYAYCLMPNHIHLLLSEKDWQRSAGQVFDFFIINVSSLRYIGYIKD